MSSFLKKVYTNSLALMTDFYQITMAYGYWKTGIAEQHSVFHLYFRKNPFHGGYSIASGLEIAIEFIKNFSFQESDLEYLKSLKDSNGNCLFDLKFLDYLKNLKFTCSIDAVPEGTVIFPNEPILRISGPIAQCQLLETPLLNIINFHTLISTKASRIVNAADNIPVFELGARRAQGIDGALSASRAAYIGGCYGTSNVLAGKIFGIPVRGTHSHSWVMSFANELDSFYAIAESMPDNAVLLVDTYNTIDGIKNAIKVGHYLKSKGKNLKGIRLDSGDLAQLSNTARKLLDEAGFNDTTIIASNDLNEYIITKLKEENSNISSLGVGTQLVTAFDEPALGAVYKLSAININNEWKYKIKISNQAIKISTPGILQIRRFQTHNEYVSDMIYDELSFNKKEENNVYSLSNLNSSIINSKNYDFQDLLIPIFKNGSLVYECPSIEEIRKNTINNLCKINQKYKKISDPEIYSVGLEKNLYEIKEKLIKENN